MLLICTIQTGLVPYLTSLRVPEIFVGWGLGRKIGTARSYRWMFSLRWSFGRARLVRYAGGPK